jgi:hypothetical protein
LLPAGSFLVTARIDALDVEVIHPLPCGKGEDAGPVPGPKQDREPLPPSSSRGDARCCFLWAVRSRAGGVLRHSLVSLHRMRRRGCGRRS